MKREEGQASLRSQIRPPSPAFHSPSDPTGSTDLVDILHTACKNVKMGGGELLKGPKCAGEAPDLSAFGIHRGELAGTAVHSAELQERGIFRATAKRFPKEARGS